MYDHKLRDVGILHREGLEYLSWEASWENSKDFQALEGAQLK